MNWRTDKPTEKVIVAKLTEDFCHIKENYSLLYLADKPYQHYSEDGEEIPYSAIEKWASLEEDKLSEGLDEAITKTVYPHIPWGDYTTREQEDIKEWVSLAGKTGAQWRDSKIPKLPDNLDEAAEDSWRMNDKLWNGLNDLDEASYQYAYDASNDWAQEKPTWGQVQDAFKAGAKWDRAKMMEGAVGAEVVAGKEGDKWFVTYVGDYESMLKVCKPGDKVKIIVISEEK